MTPIPLPYLVTTCKKEPICKFIGQSESKDVCLKNSPFAAAIIQLETVYANEAKENDPNYPKGDNCSGMDVVQNEELTSS